MRALRGLLFFPQINHQSFIFSFKSRYNEYNELKFDKRVPFMINIPLLTWYTL